MPPLLLLLFSPIDKVYCNITRRKKEWNKWLSDKLKLVNKVISYRVNGYWLHLCVFWKNTLFCRIWSCWELSYHYVMSCSTMNKKSLFYLISILKKMFHASSGFNFENTWFQIWIRSHVICIFCTSHHSPQDESVKYVKLSRVELSIVVLIVIDDR